MHKWELIAWDKAYERLRTDTLLKIAKRFSSAVVRHTHELLLANVVEWG
jgi:hypothetical protein